MKVNNEIEFQNRILDHSIEEDHKILKSPSTPIDNINENEAMVARHHMIEMMIQNKGVGLAAPQLGVNKRMLVMKKGRENSELIFMINPVMTKISPLKMKFDEGCLSVPGVTIRTHRSRQVEVEYKDENLKPRMFRLSGRDAVVFQHELDHLNGILMLNKGVVRK